MQIRFGSTFVVTGDNTKATRIIQQIVGEDGSVDTDGNTHTMPGRFDEQVRKTLREEGVTFNELA